MDTVDTQKQYQGKQPGKIQYTDKYTDHILVGSDSTDKDPGIPIHIIMVRQFDFFNKITENTNTADTVESYNGKIIIRFEKYTNKIISLFVDIAYGRFDHKNITDYDTFLEINKLCLEIGCDIGKILDSCFYTLKLTFEQMQEVLKYYVGSFDPYDGDICVRPGGISLMFMMALPNDKFFKSVTDIMRKIFESKKPEATPRNIKLLFFLLAKIRMDTDRERNVFYASYQAKLHTIDGLGFIDYKTNGKEHEVVTCSYNNLYLIGYKANPAIYQNYIIISDVTNSINNMKTANLVKNSEEQIKKASSSDSSSDSESDSDSDKVFQKASTRKAPPKASPKASYRKFETSSSTSTSSDSD